MGEGPYLRQNDLGGRIAGVTEGSDHWALGDHIHGARKAADGFFAGERGFKERAELPVLSGERGKNAAGDIGVRKEWRRSELPRMEHPSGAE